MILPSATTSWRNGRHSASTVDSSTPPARNAREIRNGLITSSRARACAK
ncbi:Uncharacterised protein [Mycobacteroides abscessus]|nr:Uncharacterised protein [Mycobacteroides abscessus]